MSQAAYRAHSNLVCVHKACVMIFFTYELLNLKFNCLSVFIFNVQKKKTAIFLMLSFYIKTLYFFNLNEGITNKQLIIYKIVTMLIIKPTRAIYETKL